MGELWGWNADGASRRLCNCPNRQFSSASPPQLRTGDSCAKIPNGSRNEPRTSSRRSRGTPSGPWRRSSTIDAPGAPTWVRVMLSNPGRVCVSGPVGLGTTTTLSIRFGTRGSSQPSDALLAAAFTRVFSWRLHANTSVNPSRQSTRTKPCYLSQRLPAMWQPTRTDGQGQTHSNGPARRLRPPVENRAPVRAVRHRPAFGPTPKLTTSVITAVST